MTTRFRAAALAAAGVFLLLGWLVQRGAGVTRTYFSDSPPAAERLAVVERPSGIDLRGLEAILPIGSGLRVTWSGAWDVPESGMYDLSIHSNGRSSWTIDGQLSAQVATPIDSGARRTVWLDSGFHSIELVYDVDPASPLFVVTAGRSGRALSSLPPHALKPRLPNNPTLRSAAVWMRYLLGWILAVMAVILARQVFSTAAERWRLPEAAPRFGRWAAWVVLALILVYGALLRIDALTARFGVVSSPAWVAAVQARTFASPAAIRPAHFPWVPAPIYPHSDGPPSRYISDPYTYLNAARAMPSFYVAHYREPVFPYAVKTALRVFDGQDVAVSFASMTFAIAAIWLTYLVGAAVWSRPAGLVAAFVLAIDRDMIAQSILGWRDDAFVAAVPLCAYLAIRCWRAGSQDVGRAFRPGGAYLAAAVLGVAAGFAILTRIMAAFFLVPTGVALVLTMRTTWKRRWTMAAIGVASASIVAAPYFVNCWRVYGDPLYTFNVHGDVYRVAEGQAERREGTFSYLKEKIASRPFTALDTVARGLTSYPFSNKWTGLEAWRDGLGAVTSMAALAGLVLLAFSPAGRLMLVVMLTSLIPFSFTWRVDPNPRFTAHVYPFLLVAAAVAMSVAARALWFLLVRGQRAKSIVAARDHDDVAPRRPRWTTSRMLASGTVAVLLCWWFLARVSSQLVFAETLSAHEDGMITATDPGLAGRGWSPELAGSGNVRMRVAFGEATLLMRLPEAADYQATIRVDPFPQPLGDIAPPLGTLEFLLNGQSIATEPMRWTPGRVGAYQVTLPRAIARRGQNELAIRLSSSGAFGFWYARISLTNSGR